MFCCSHVQLECEASIAWKPFLGRLGSNYLKKLDLFDAFNLEKYNSYQSRQNIFSFIWSFYSLDSRFRGDIKQNHFDYAKARWAL